MSRLMHSQNEKVDRMFPDMSEDRIMGLPHCYKGTRVAEFAGPRWYSPRPGQYEKESQNRISGRKGDREGKGMSEGRAEVGCIENSLRGHSLRRNGR
jgi:hypothetical protein